MIKIQEKVCFVSRSDSYHIVDTDKNLQWFIEVNHQNEKLVGMQEKINPELFRKQGVDYMNSVFKLIVNDNKKNNK